jgi:tRNA (guanine-N7-)-methyltransferase
MRQVDSGVEYEFGVPFPGRIREPSAWTQTALKRLPASGPLRWQEIFGRAAPVVLDLGCGNGRALILSALNRADHDHFGLDILPVVIRYATRRANQRGLSNIRFAVGEARDFLTRLVASHSVAEVHIYHPQPYYDIAEVHRRLITPEFLAQVVRVLVPDGKFVIQTDNPGYWSYIREVAPHFFDFEERHEPWPDAPRGRTRREILALQQGLLVFRGVGSPRKGLDEETLRTLSRQLPPPIFDADRRSRYLDQLEQQAEFR